MSIALYIVGAVLLTASVGWVLVRPPNRSPDRKMCLGVEFEALVLSAATIGGVLAFLLARHV